MKQKIFSDKEIRIQFFIFLGIGAIIYIVASVTDLFEQIYKFIRRNEKYNLDEFFLVFICWTILLLIFTVKKTRLIRKQNLTIYALHEDLKKHVSSSGGELQAILAHDLKAPFNPIIGLSDLLIKKEGMLDSNSRLRYLRLINDTSRATYHLIENILDWSALKSGKLTPAFEKVQVSELIEDSITLMKASAFKKQIELLSNVSEDIFVKVDRNMMRTVLRNLISNAIKFSDKGSTVNIDSNFNKSTVEITVSDKGIGMYNEQIDKILSNKIQSTLGTNKESGTGLGLVICNKFIEQNNGRLKIKSEVGNGSAFGFTLSLA